jgi:MoaA/NifB/PqqE/SkfB family radical SAM enzyme
MYPKVGFNELKNSIDTMIQEKKVDSIVVSGGEPTIHSDFFDIIKYMTEKNLNITVLSNSERFYEKEFCKEFSEIVNKEKTMVITTIHSQNQEEHEFINQSKGSFIRSIEGLKQLALNGVDVTVKHCITRLNHKDLAKFYKFINSEFTEKVSIQLCSIDYCGLKEDELESNMLDFPRLQSYFEEMFDLYIEDLEKGSKRNVYCINMPLCSCDPYYWRFFTMKTGNYKGYASPNNKGEQKLSDNIENNTGTFAQECMDCIVNEICPGTYRTAFECYGNKIVKKYTE